MYRCVLRCTAHRAVGHPIQVTRKGDLVTVEAESYEEFVNKCAEWEVHCQDLVEGEWPDKPHPAHKARLKPRRRFLERVVEKTVEIAKTVSKSSSSGKVYSCEVCGQEFKKKKSRDEHQSRHKEKPE